MSQRGSRHTSIISVFTSKVNCFFWKTNFCKGGIIIAAYIPFTQDQLDDAKHADLAAFLESRGETLRRSGSELEWADHHITIRGHTLFDHYNNKGDSAIDFVRKYFNTSLQDAVQMLLGRNTIVVAPVEPRQQQRERERPEFQLPEKNETMRRVYAYLLKQRCIDRAVLDHFAHEHLSYETLPEEPRQRMA